MSKLPAVEGVADAASDDDDDMFDALSDFSEDFPTGYRGVSSLVKQSQ